MDDLLFRWFPFISWDQVIITKRKQLIKGDVLIDDGIHNLEGGDYVKILMTAPHNRSYDAEGNGMIRVSSWKEIEKVISELEEQGEL
jgi:5'(3')-deoxyribonucleotidase